MMLDVELRVIELESDVHCRDDNLCASLSRFLPRHQASCNTLGHMHLFPLMTLPLGMTLTVSVVSGLLLSVAVALG
ncbi:unnamed protein product [Boreogadus saida]